MADLSWKDIFKDPILQDYIDEGLNNNLDIRIALQQINAAESYLTQGKAGYFTTIGAQAEGMHQKFSKNTTTGAMQSSTNQLELSAGLSWGADTRGTIRSGKRAAEAGHPQRIAAPRAVKG